VALAQEQHTHPVPRILVLAVIAAAFVPAIVFADAASERTGYPFLEAGPARAPDALHLTVYVPAPTYEAVGLRPTGSSVAWDGRGVVIALRSVTGPDGSEVLIWESTRSDATPDRAAGRFGEDGTLAGTLAEWRAGHTADGRRLIHARIGQTLVVIVGSVSFDSLLRIADSLRKTTVGSLIF
jgi:hypothetical protein